MTLLSASKLLVKWVAVKAVSTINFKQNKSIAVSAGSVGVHRKVVAACALSLCFFLNTAYAVDYTFTSSSTGSFNLNSGDTLTIQSGTFQTGTNGLNQIPSGATVTVESGATLDASNNFNGGAGTLNVNDGAVATFGGPPISGMTFNIDGNVSFGSNPSMNAPSLFNISSTGVMNLDGQFTLANSSVITNNGSIFYDSDFSIQGGTTFDNNSYVKGSALTGNLNLNGNTVNDGLIDTEGFINFNSQGDVVNQCSMIALNGYNNQSASTINSGIIITVNPTSVLQNNNTFNNTATGYLQAGGTINQNFLNNNGGIFGGGNIYIAGNSTNQAAFGTDTDTNVINVYDPSVAALGATVYFDTQNVTPDLTEVTKVAFSPLTAQDVRDNYLNSGICNYDPFATAVASVDYGDAPDSYQDASHTIVSGMQLGALGPDAETVSLNAANGGVDGTGDNLAGIADEDGVTIPPLTLGVAAVITATVSGTNGKLQGWIDWNGDGDFDDLGEQLLSNVQDNGVGDADLNVGSIGFSVTPALSSTTGTTYARFRWSSDSNVGSTGLANDGEVEDYEINIADAVVGSCESIPPGEPTAAVAGSDITWNISNGELTSIEVQGSTDVYNGFITTDRVEYSFANVGANNQIISNRDGTKTIDITDGAAIFDPAVLAAVSDRHLGHYLQLDNGITSTDYFNFLYDDPIKSASNRYVLITERGGNNNVSVQALDASGNLIGTPISANSGSYTGTGFSDPGNGQEIQAYVYPLTALVASTTEIYGLRYTQVGADSKRNDGGDGKVFIVVDSSQVCDRGEGSSGTPTTADEAVLTLEKIVINDDAGTSLDTAWTLSATDGTTTISGVEGDAAITAATVALGTYTLSESGPAGYTQTALSCSGAADTDLSDGLTLADGEVVTCTFTNDDDEPSSPTEVAANVCAIAPSTQFWLRAAEWSADAAPNGFGAKNINYTALASADPFTFGSGITVANVSSRTEITGVDQTNYTDAFIDGDYIEYTFTMQNGLSDTYVLSGMSENGGTLGENYKIDFMISSNDFATATRLATGVPVDADIPSNTFSWITDAAQVYLTAGTQYKVRAVFYDATAPSGRISMDDFAISIDQCTDKGDAPYGTGDANAGSHYLAATRDYYIGTVSPDAEFYVTNDDNTSGDVTTDEEAGVVLPVFPSGATVSIDIPVNGSGGKLNAWIDWNGNEVFDSNEKIATDVGLAVPAASGTITLPVTVPANAVGGNSYARFRWSPNSVVNATDNVLEGEIEDYPVVISTGSTLSGIIFEDINYGGGAGRDLVSASGVGLNGVTVELYDNTGAYVTSTTTANNGTSDGAYEFTGISDGDYFVRVVNDTVGSTRSGANGSELGVQTFRSDGTTDVSNEVGGRNPAVADASGYNAGSPSTLNTTTYQFTNGALNGQQAQSLQAITVAAADASDINFGFNFDTIVNTNDAGQGSLRQFILNSNLLTGEASLAQVGQPAGWETSIFMIPSADLSAGVATIELDTGLPIITGSSTALDAGTQTSNIGNTNAGTSGTGGTVGVDNLVLPTYQNPEVEIDANDFNGLRVDSAGEVLIARIAIYDTDAASPLIDKAGVGLTSASLLTIENAFIGPRATGADPGAGERLGRSYDDVDFTSPPNVIFRDSLFAYSENSGLHADDTGGTYHLSGSELHHLVLTNSGQDAVDAGGTWTTIGNLMHNNGSSSSSSSSGGAGFELGAASNAQVSANSVIENNTLHSNFGPGIRLRNTVTNTTVSKNVIYDNLYAGVQVQLRATGVGVESTITQNSIYNNAELGIDISHNTSTGDPDQVTLNDANDVDGGPNGGLNFPQFTRAVQSGSDLIIQGCAPTGSTIELFEADVSAGSSSGASAGDNQFGLTQDYGEGETYITSFVEGVGEDSSLNTVSCNGLSDADGNDASGMSPFQWRVALPSGLQIGDKITATATIAGTGTSEFSPVAVISGQDYGDAPNSYRTTLLSDGARHDIINGVYLGNAQPDIDVDGQPSVAASADGADEDGVSSFNSLTTSDRIYSVSARVNNDTVDQATLIAWIDFDRNGSFDADEAAIRTIPAGTNAANFTLNWSNIPLDIAAGDTFVRLRVTTDSLNNREPFGAKLDGEVEDYPITITIAGVTVSGRVYNDANVNTVSDSNEVGVTQLPVVLYDTVNNVCVSTRTDGSGRFIFKDVVAGTYQVYEASRENVPVPNVCGVAGAKNPSGYRSTTDNVRAPFTVTSNDITGQDFGDVKSPVFEPSNTDKILPGNVLFYTHKLTTPAKGTVTFDSVSSGNKSKGWASIIYRDANCDGQLNQTDHTMRLSGQSVAVSAGDSVCVINKVYAPSNVAANDQYVQTITADFDYNNAIAGSVALSVTDVTTAGQVATPTLPATPAVAAEPATPAQAPVEATPTTPYIPAVEEVPAQAPVAATPVTPVVGPSRLELRKTVRNVSQAGSLETETINQALPGDTLEYRVYYSNTGTGPVTELVINDNVPPYTSLQGMPTCGTAPAGMTCTSSLPSGDAVEWVFSGALVGGASGVVSYQVVVDD
ncbi:DUF11 domain-containing protein [Leucothrix sargassi]|nr:DUF11 domain-containing protein [Leucothrix sargassi]